MRSSTLRSDMEVADVKLVGGTNVDRDGGRHMERARDGKHGSEIS